MEKQKEEGVEERYEEVDAYPHVGMLSDIKINEKDTPICIGGWNTGGFYLEEPYILREEKGNNFMKDVTYYRIVKDKKLQSEREKRIREDSEKRKREDIEYYKKSIKDAEERIENYTKKLKELNSNSSQC